MIVSPAASGLASRGHCRRCGVEHSLPAEPALAEAERLKAKLAADEDLHFGPRGEQPNAPSTASLFGPARGKMFGVLVGRCRETGAPRTLRAFSGQYERRWLIDGWVGPLFDVAAWHEADARTEPRIKALTAAIDGAADDNDAEARAALVQRRRALSRALMLEFHALYRLHDFRGTTATLSDVIAGPAGTGTGDCCAPKLLNAAVLSGVTPVAIAEFYWGRTNLSGSRTHGTSYASCRAKCAPILGFQLCGL
ncbi:MAG: hypothetical protein AAF721_15855 [Myxococcota bacterium]